MGQQEVDSQQANSLPATTAEGNTNSGVVRQFQAFSGNLASFEAAGQTAKLSERSGVGNHPQPTWNVTLAGNPTIGELSQLHNARLTAVRQDRQSAEIVVISESSLSEPTDVRTFLRNNPSFRSGEGVILDRRMLDTIRDRLLPYGMGWKLWLLIDDKLFQGWVANVERTLANASRTWEHVDSVSGSLRVDRRTQRPTFRLSRINYRPDRDMPDSTSSRKLDPGGN